MIIAICENPLKGRHKTVGKIDDRPGAFAVLSEFYVKYYLLDVDCLGEMKKAEENHKVRKCWEMHRKGLIRYAMLYKSDFPPKAKEEIVKEVRKSYVTILYEGGPR